MNSVLYAKDLSPDTFQLLWRELQPPQGAYIWIQWDRPRALQGREAPGYLGTLEAYLRDHHASYELKDAPLCSSTQGRIFWPQGELRWRRLSLSLPEDTIRVVYLGEEPPPIEPDDLEDHSKQLAAEGVRDQKTLWIELRGGGSKGHDDGVWDKSLPDQGTDKRLKLKLKQYKKADASIAFERFVTIEARPLQED